MKLSSQHLVSLLKIHKKLPLTKNIIKILYTISEEATKLLSGDRATIYIHDAGKKSLYSYVASKLEIDEIRLKVGEGIAGKAASNKKSLIVNDVSQCDDFNAFYDSQTSYTTRNIITAPLLNKENELVGVIQVLNKKDGDFSAKDLEILEILASVSAIALEQAQLSNENQLLREYNRQLIQNFNAGIAVLDNEFRVQDFNDKFLDMFNLEKDIEDQYLKEISRAIYNEVSSSPRGHSEIRIKDKYYNITSSDLRDTEEQQVGILLLVTDITEKVKQRHAKELEERMSILGKMSSQIIHDIKNPLFVLRGYAKLLSHAPEQDDRDRYINVMEKEITHILDITQEILDFSRGDIEVVVSRYPMLTINNHLLEMIAKLRETYQADINCILDNHHEDAILKIDQGKLDRALRNILINAIEASKDPATTQIELETQVTEKYFKILIKDNGKGIPEEISDSLFNPFVSYKKEKGTGLGLSISKAIIEKHEGNIKLTESRDWQTIFEITFPLSA